MRWVAVVIAAAAGTAGQAGAQFISGPGWGGGYYTRGNFNVGFGGPNFSVRSITAQVIAYPAPRPLYGAAYGLYPPPGLGGFAWGPPPVVMWQPPMFAAGQGLPPLVGMDVRNDPEPPRIAANEKDFIAIRPGQQPPKLADNLPRPVPPQVVLVPAPAAVPVDARADRKADPRAESARQLALARSAFAAEEYGRAAERLSAAIRAKPDESRPHFLLAQVRTARGEYAEAVAAIRDGLKLDPDWPAAAYRPKEFYGVRPDRFDAHLAELRAAVAAHPADPAAGFLLAYHLWFTGAKDEAVKLFRRVTKQVKDNAIVERFLREVDAKVAGR